MSAQDRRDRPRRDLLAVGRSDRWGMVGLVTLVAVVTVVAEVLSPVLAWLRGEALRVPAFGPVQVPVLDGAGVRHSEASYDVHLVDPTTAQRVLDLVPGVLLTLVVAGACWMVLALVRDVAAGDPFRGRAAGRLWLLALLLAAGVPVAWFLRAAVDVVLLTEMHLGPGGPGVSLDLPWAAVLAGAVAALIASAFQSGARLREDVDGLV